MSAATREVETYLLENGFRRVSFTGTEYAWGFREGEPILAFIGGRDGEEGFQAAAQLYWSSADYIMKP